MSIVVCSPLVSRARRILRGPAARAGKNTFRSSSSLPLRTSACETSSPLPSPLSLLPSPLSLSPLLSPFSPLPSPLSLSLSPLLSPLFSLPSPLSPLLSPFSPLPSPFSPLPRGEERKGSKGFRLYDIHEYFFAYFNSCRFSEFHLHEQLQHC